MSKILITTVFITSLAIASGSAYGAFFVTRYFDQAATEKAAIQHICGRYEAKTGAFVWNDSESVIVSEQATEIRPITPNEGEARSAPPAVHVKKTHTR